MQSTDAPMSREALFDRLAPGHAARTTVVTPNRRLAQALARAHDECRANAGLPSWESADILPWAGFVERLWDEALHAPCGDGLPLLLAPAEEQALWEAIVGDSRQARDLLSTVAPARLARDAWQLARGWRIEPAASAEGNEDTRAWRDWAARYERRTREASFVEGARLPDLLAPRLHDLGEALPATLVLYAFDLLAPQQREFLRALQDAGTTVLACAPPRHEARVRRAPLATPREEIAAAARWARARLDSAAQEGRVPRIGVVVPDLAQSRAVVQRVFASTLHPGHNAPGSPRPPHAFEVSLGLPLAAYPIVHDALAVLGLAGREIAFAEASRLLRSPFLAGAAPEMAARSRLDAALRERAGVTLTLDHLCGHLAARGMPHAPMLAGRIAKLAEFRRSDLFRARPPPDWARVFAEALRVAGFPGDRPLDSAEYQALGKWRDLLSTFARLERVAGKMGYQEALGRLSRLAGDTLFQPETPEVPVRVMGILESAGLDFDHLWVMGLTDDAWPLAARPNPFLPISRQRIAGIPEADAASSLALDRRITEGWLHAAPEVVFSHALAIGEAQVSPSPLVAAIPARAEGDPPVPAVSGWREAIHAAAALERLVDDRGPALAGAGGAGGTAIFRDQAACPFRAFATHRLGSARLEEPQQGLTAADRGTLVHAVLASAWDSIHDKGTLDAMTGPQLDALLVRVAGEALERIRRRRPQALEGRYAAMERDRLASLARAWLDHERGRGDFEVLATERKLAVSFGGVTVNAKLDRLDRLAAGGCAVIDYKTGAAQVARWLGPRPDEPQVPMYALAGGEDVAAVAFAQVKVGSLAFKGLARAEGLLPGAGLVSKDRSHLASDYADWTALLEGWRREFDALGRAYASGDARVDPKHGAPTCAGCDQRLVCRVADGRAPAEDEQPEDADE